ncbi:MAG: hypothetical protein ABGZ17_26630 [Planctomycetaceae bacterium]
MNTAAHFEFVDVMAGYSAVATIEMPLSEFQQPGTVAEAVGLELYT